MRDNLLYGKSLDGMVSIPERKMIERERMGGKYPSSQDHEKKSGEPVAKTVASFAPVSGNLADFCGLCRTLAFRGQLNVTITIQYLPLNKRSRADWIRTSDLLNPIQAHYQAVLRPDL